jgi:antitoxin PrlF
VRIIISTITNKGQVTIPAAVRQALGLKPGDKISFVLDEHGSVQLRSLRYPNIESIVGAAGSLPNPLPWEAMRRMAEEDRIAEEYGRPM